MPESRVSAPALITLTLTMKETGVITRRHPHQCYASNGTLTLVSTPSMNLVTVLNLLSGSVIVNGRSIGRGTLGRVTLGKVTNSLSMILTVPDTFVPAGTNVEPFIKP